MQAAGLHHLLHGATPAPSRPLEGGQQQQRRQQQPPLRCPRCDSTNTKFCYYNNYSLSQPRHFCKACKRYWTRGGTLRNVPVGGGCRKNKRIKRTASVAAPTGTSSSSSNKNNNPLLHIPTTNNSSHMIKTTTLPTSSDLSPLFYSLSSASSNILQMDTIGIINEFESILTTPLPIGTTAPNEFQPQEHCSLPTSTSLLQDYSMQLGPSLVSSSYPEGARTTKTTTPSSSSWLPFYQGLQGGVYAGDANLGGLLMKEIKEEDGRGLELQPTCSENQLEPLPSGAINPLWSSVMSGEWSTEPAASTLFESSASTPLISSESLLD